jgi:SNF2 family DNA or RNA helicase
MSQPFVPRPWQPEMIDHIVEHPRCAVFAKPGAGKTGTTLLALQGIAMLDEGPGLILGPKRVAHGVWTKEAAKWSNINCTVVAVEGDKWSRARALKRKADFYAINYEQLPWLVEHFGDAWPFRTIIADESTRLKGFRLRQGGQRTRALGKVAHRPDVARFVLLTGTPSPNGLKDLWGQLWFLDRGERLGKTWDAFTSRWFRPSWDGYGLEPFDHSQDQIQEKIRDLCITVDPGDYLPIDEPIESVVEVELPPAAREQYREMERKMFLELEASLGGHEIEALNAAARTDKCLQIANGSIYHDEDGSWTELHTAKLDALESLVEEAGGMPVLVGYQFVSDLARLRSRFSQLKTLDEITIEDFATGHYPILAGHPASMGHGVDGLQYGTNIMIDFSSGWNLEHDQQILERIGPTRQMQAGLNRSVYRYRIVAKDTVDELVALRREGKADVQQILLDAMNRNLK